MSAASTEACSCILQTVVMMSSVHLCSGQCPALQPFRACGVHMRHGMSGHRLRVTAIAAPEKEAEMYNVPSTSAEVPKGLNKFSSKVTQPKSQGASQAMLYATGMVEGDMDKPQVTSPALLCLGPSVQYNLSAHIHVVMITWRVHATSPNYHSPLALGSSSSSKSASINTHNACRWASHQCGTRATRATCTSWIWQQT